MNTKYVKIFIYDMNSNEEVSTEENTFNKQMTYTLQVSWPLSPTIAILTNGPMAVTTVILSRFSHTGFHSPNSIWLNLSVEYPTCLQSIRIKTCYDIILQGTVSHFCFLIEPDQDIFFFTLSASNINVWNISICFS